MSDHIDRVRDALESAGIEVNEVRALPTGLGRQLRCAGGRVVVVYDSGAVVAQGKDTGVVKGILDGLKRPAKARTPNAVRAAPGLQPDMVESIVPAPAPDARQLWTDLPWDGSMPWDPIPS